MFKMRREFWIRLALLAAGIAVVVPALAALAAPATKATKSAKTAAAAKAVKGAPAVRVSGSAVGAAGAAAAAEAEAPGAGETSASGEPAGPATDAAVAPLLPGSPKALSHHLPGWARYEVMAIAVWQFFAAFLLVLAGLVLKKVSDYVFDRRVIPLLTKTRFHFDHLLAGAAARPLGHLVLLAGLAAAVWVLALPEAPTDVRGVAFAALKVLLVADILWFLLRLVDVLAIYLTQLAGRTESALDDQIIPLIRKALKVTIGLLLSVWVVQLLGYSVSSLLAGLGIGGLAVALALQDTLANFFGSVFIFLDRPFAVGDMVRIEGVEGVVEEIGFRTTRIRTWPKTLVCIPNKTVAAATIDNWSQMPVRRVAQTVGVTYATTADQMEQAVAALRGILEADEGVDPEFIVVRFEDFGASSLNIRVIYFTKAVPYPDHLATKERVNLAIMRALAGLGLSIAFPTRTIHIEGDVARGLASGRDPQA
ncbi:MAG: mechanosensitive ion channel family protein [Planctomycetes bacterium]|nr:mechanosensitive ion channel family protein [Planctomycetota bacterium]